MQLVQIIADPEAIDPTGQKEAGLRFPVRNALGTVEARVDTRPDWLKNTTSMTIGATLDELDQTFSSVCSALREFGPGAFRLDQIDPTTGSPEHIVAVLRAAWPWRASIPGYDSFVRQVEKGLHDRAFSDIDVVLHGLVSEPA
jgi:hypothetical protein